MQANLSCYTIMMSSYSAPTSLEDDSFSGVHAMQDIQSQGTKTTCIGRWITTVYID